MAPDSATPLIPAPPDEQRRSRRPRVLLAGRLVYGDGDLTSECAIRDLTESGARVRLASPVPLPARVWLIEIRSAVAYECEIAWRRAPDFGLRFLSRRALQAERAPDLGMLKRVWVESAAR